MLIDNNMEFAAELAPISWISACMFAIMRRRHAGSINTRSTPCDLVIFAKPAQYRLVNTLPYTRLHPFVQATSTGHSATTP